MTNSSTNSSSRRALVTGGSGLIGRALISQFEKSGWKVIAPTREQCDLSTPGEIERFIESTGAFDLLINNAADQSVLQLSGSSDSVAKLFQINVFSPLAAMTAAKKLGVKTCINISSIEAVTPRAGHEIYGASKAALEALTKSLAVSLAPMRVNGVRLGLVGDEGLEGRWPEGVNSWKVAVPARRYASPNEVAAFLLTMAGEEFAFTTGAIIDFDGGKSASPGW